MTESMKLNLARDVILDALQALGYTTSGPGDDGATYAVNPAAGCTSSAELVQQATIYTDLDDNGNILGIGIRWGTEQ